MKKLSQSILLLAGVVVLTLATMNIVLSMPFYTSQKAGVTTAEPQRNYSEEELKQYDGTDSNKPIYLAFQGNVYDVTQGKKFYEPGANYHYLAGKDSTLELTIAGGNIVKNKYPVVGKLVK